MKGLVDMRAVEYFKWMFSIFYLIAEKIITPPKQKQIKGGSFNAPRITMK